METYQVLLYIEVGNYYYGHENFPIGVSDFSRIWGKVGNIDINLQDAMNALYQIMTSRSHVWVGDGNSIPDYARLFIQTDTNNS